MKIFCLSTKKKICQCENDSHLGANFIPTYLAWFGDIQIVKIPECVSLVFGHVWM